MDPKLFIRFLDARQWMVAQYTADITHEEGCRPAPGGGNSFNWILGHLTAYRNDMLKLAGEPPVPMPERMEQYARGATGGADPASAVTIPEMLEVLNRSHAALKAKLETMPPSDFDRPLEKGTAGEAFAFLNFHETYHAGQLGLARRLLGKEGVIQ
jgi:uncharacterized damage-inducible protein DinB